MAGQRYQRSRGEAWQRTSDEHVARILPDTSADTVSNALNGEFSAYWSVVTRNTLSSLSVGMESTPQRGAT